MDTDAILFVGGPAKRASVQIRCVQIATQLGCAYKTDVSSLEQIGRHHRVLVCVKPDLTAGELLSLSRDRIVIWDVHDTVPPARGLQYYLVGTKHAQQLFSDLGEVVIIPHHHCNLARCPAPPGNRMPGWIGRDYWQPTFPGITLYNVNSRGMSALQLAQEYQRLGIGLNFRAQTPDTGFHAQINPGTKLINCLGFGLPSISDDEPAYREYGAECTIISTLQDCAKHVLRLQQDPELHGRMRQACLRAAEAFHLENIALQYLRLFSQL